MPTIFSWSIAAKSLSRAATLNFLLVVAPTPICTTHSSPVQWRKGAVGSSLPHQESLASSFRPHAVIPGVVLNFCQTEVIERDGSEHYRVRWDDDGSDGIFYPGSTTHVVNLGARRK